jgi:hypothetical protein
MEDPLTKRTKKTEEEPDKKGHGASPDVESSESEFDRFEGLTQKLVNTPKPKADEKDAG